MTEWPKVNQEYQKLLPPLSHSEYEALKTSIKENGLYSPITVNKEGVILDGYHRYKACVELGVEARYEVREFENPLLERMFVIEANLHRRHLNDFQKVELSLPLFEIESELARQRRLAGKTLSSNELKGQARDITAKKIGVSPTTFQRAKVILERGSEELRESVRRGKTSIAYAYKMVKRPEESQRAPPLPSGEGEKGKAWIIPLEHLSDPAGHMVEVEADYVPETTTKPEELDGKYFAFIFFSNSKVYETIKRNIAAIASKYLIDLRKPTESPLIIFTDLHLKMFGDKRLNSLAGKKSRPSSGYFREGWTYWGMGLLPQNKRKGRALT